MLTLTYSKELDTGVSLETAPFAVNVNGSSRSLSGVAVGQSSVLLLLSQPVEAGDMVTVDYTVPDGPDFIRDTLGRKAASFSRQAVTNSTAEDQEDAARGTEDADTEPEYASAVVEPTLTVTVHDVPSSHNGQDAFTFELRFSEDPKPDFSYTTVRDHAFTVAGGSVTYVRRLVPAQQYRVGGPRHARRQRGRQPVAPKHHRLLRPGSHLHRGRQETVRRASAGRCGAEHPGHGSAHDQRHRPGRARP